MGDHLDAVTQYGPGSKPDEAAAKMEEAGFTKNNGTWQDQDGNTYEFNIQTPPWPAPLGVAQTIADQLSSFGIDASVQQLEASQWISNYENGDFALRGGYFGGGPHPFFSFDAFQSSTYQAANIPMEVELPPVGEPDGETSSFNVEEAVNALATATDEDEETRLVRELAWYANQYIPIIPLTNGFSPNYYNPAEFTFPDPEEDPRMYNEYTKDYMFKVPQEEGSDQAVLQARTD
jgi:peptide/nickel transport system substrate-binding protein